MALPFRLDLLSSGDGDALLQREILELLGPKEVPSQAFEQGVLQGASSPTVLMTEASQIIEIVRGHD
jgi:hypothetical protein